MLEEGELRRKRGESQTQREPTRTPGVAPKLEAHPEGNKLPHPDGDKSNVLSSVGLHPEGPTNQCPPSHPHDTLPKVLLGPGGSETNTDWRSTY